VRTVPGRPGWFRLAAAGVTVVLWASAFVAIRGADREFSAGALALGRLACGSVVLGLVAWARREGWPPRAAWPGIVASGVLWFGVYMVALNWGEQKVDAGTAAMVVGVGPVIIALLGGWLLGAAVGALACLPFTGQLVSEVASAPLPATLSVCSLGVFPTAVAFTTWAYALARTPAGTMGATTYLVLALTVLLSWSALGQVPGWLAVAGGALCLAGVALSRRRAQAPEPRSS
jgi:drug/metabolite transporter (DMT)-like permease